MSSSGLSSQLQDYLARSPAGSQQNSNNGQSGGFGGKMSSWFSKPKENPDQSTEDTMNGWFNEAQKDPLLPSLVRIIN